MKEEQYNSYSPQARAKPESQDAYREQAEWYMNMIDHAAVLIWMAGKDKKCTFLNNTWLQYTGHKHLVAAHHYSLIHPEDRDKYIQTFETAMEQQQPFEIEYRLLKGNDEYGEVSENANPVFLKNEFVGYVGSCTETGNSHRVKHEKLEAEVKSRVAEVQEANASLQRSNEELQTFAYAASHDLQEPLRKIITFVDRLQEKHAAGMSEDGKGLMLRIVESSKRMSGLIEDLLNFSRATRTPADKIAKTDMKSVAENVLKDFDLLIHQKNAEINIGTLPEIKAVRFQMMQLFHNLVSNALKFARPEDSPVINISSKPISAAEAEKFAALSPDLSYVKITIADNGIGFDQAHAENIFQIFKRLHGKSEYPGTGIGLALCRKIVENHQGIIYAESKPNSGAIFHIILPVN